MSQRSQPSQSKPASSSNGGSKSKQIKLVLLGESGVGKSSIALRYVRGEFNENGEATIGAAFLTKTVNVRGQNVKFDIWDTAGQERYHSLAPMYYRGAPAAIVVYDVTSQSSYIRAQAWIKELLQQGNSQMVICLAGNKADMASEKRAISREDGKEHAEENGLLFAETSAKTGLNIEDMFINLAAKIVATTMPPGDEEEHVKLDNNRQKSGGCC